MLIAASHYYMDQEACCRTCGATDGCAAAVFRGPACDPYEQLCRGHCTHRSAADMLMPVNATDNSTACIPDAVTGTGVISINATVPGDLVTDVQNAGIAPDPLTDTNWKNSTFWNGKRWTYTKRFPWPPVAASDSRGDEGARLVDAGGEVLLVFEGIKMGASIVLNGHLLGNVTDQFLRVSYPVQSLLLRNGGGGGGGGGTDVAPENVLEVVFDRSIGTHGRFMACSGGWDWAGESIYWVSPRICSKT